MDWGDRGSLIITRKYSPQDPFPAGNHRTLQMVRAETKAPKPDKL